MEEGKGCAAKLGTAEWRRVSPLTLAAALVFPAMPVTLHVPVAAHSPGGDRLQG